MNNNPRYKKSSLNITAKIGAVMKTEFRFTRSQQFSKILEIKNKAIQKDIKSLKNLKRVVNFSGGETISAIYKKRGDIKPVHLAQEPKQKPISEDLVYKIVPKEDRINLVNLSDDTQISNPSGLYCYIIPPNDPTQVYCCKEDRDKGHGHYSMTLLLGVSNVFFAGEVKFNDGSLEYYNPKSGHFRPPVSLKASNILPPATYVLPTEKFKGLE